MTLLLAAAHLPERQRIADGALAPLARSLAEELRPLLDRPPELPNRKALLSRQGGRCPRDGALLEFDPWSPERHRCTVCGEVQSGERHHLWWVMSQQLWIAERSVIAATLQLLTGESRTGTFARAVLEETVERYLALPNRDNVLGPSRPFFSTYLESIWLLQLCVALDLLEMHHDADRRLGDRVRERVIEPSVELIVSFNEGSSNRQVWNAAACIAAGSLLSRENLVELGVHGPSGLIHHLTHGLLADGTWYEGENYHLFAHRGLWYAVTMCEAAGIPLPEESLTRFAEGFAAPLLTALPDMTMPSRRDSQYAVSLRQWRTAESLELGLARGYDSRLAGGLWELYEHGGERTDPERWRSTAEVERNVTGSALRRADLGWKSLLHARERLPVLKPDPPDSLLLEAQGLVVLRPEPRTYVALEYGEPGGGHGHSDRLGLMLVVGDERWLDDPGTGSYVDPSLFWYRSTLAHNAPLADGRSQQPARGVLCAFEVFKRHAWAEAELAAPAFGNVRFRRTIVTTAEYLLDLISWQAENGRMVDVPFHVPYDAAPLGWRVGGISGSAQPSDGFRFLADIQVADVAGGAVALRLGESRRDHNAALLPLLAPGTEAIWWRARAPGPPPPGSKPGAVLALRTWSGTGALASVWTWGAPLERLEGTVERIVIHFEGHRRPDVHERRPGGWSVTRPRSIGTSRVELRGVRHSGADGAPHMPGAPDLQGEPVVLRRDRPFHRVLSVDSYRRSEDSWADAGRPSATVDIRVTNRELLIDVAVRKHPVIFRAQEDDPELDNEHSDIHSDGVQLHLLPAGALDPICWLLVPETEARTVRTHRSGGGSVPDPRATWSERPDGYAMQVSLTHEMLSERPGAPFALDVLINEAGAGRLRRRGQLVLSGARGEWVYLRGDRQPAERFLRFRISDD